METREALLRAGRMVFARDGYHGASLDRIATEAGFTKGAVYANFPTKADLLLEIYERRADERVGGLRRAAESAKNLEQLRERVHREWRQGLETERGWALLRMEFWAHAAREPGLAERLRSVHLPVRAAIAKALADVAGRCGEDLPFPAEELAILVMSLGNGLTLEAFLDDGDLDRLYALGTEKLGRVPDGP